jgi:hypothetical protein
MKGKEQQPVQVIIKEIPLRLPVIYYCARNEQNGAWQGTFAGVEGCMGFHATCSF